MQPHRQRARIGHGAAIYRPLPPSFYARAVHDVARALIGTLLVRRDERGLRVARICETEAYAGRIDPASHSFRGRTPRCATMFGPAGRLYVYFTYGAHFCVNVVAGSRRDAAAVLLRAAEPLDGIEAMRAARLARTKPGATFQAIERGELDTRLLSGPGNLAAAFGFDRAQDGTDLTRPELVWLARGRAARRVHWTPRIGLSSSVAGPWHWRVVDTHSDASTRVPSAWPVSRGASPPVAHVRRIVAPARK